MSRIGTSVGLLPSRLLGLPVKASIIFQSSGVAMTRAPVNSCRRFAPPKWSRWPWSMMMYLMSRVDTDLLDIRLDHVDEGLLRRVEQDVALRSLQDPRRHIAGTDMVEIVEDLKGLHLLDLDFARAGTDAAGLLERIVGRNLRVGAGGGRSCGGAGRSSFCFRVLRKCRRSKKTGGHEAARRQHPDFSHPILPWSVLGAIEFFALPPVYRVGVRYGNSAGPQFRRMQLRHRHFGRGD